MSALLNCLLRTCFGDDTHDQDDSNDNNNNNNNENGSVRRDITATPQRMNIFRSQSYQSTGQQQQTSAAIGVVDSFDSTGHANAVDTAHDEEQQRLVDTIDGGHNGQENEEEEEEDNFVNNSRNSNSYHDNDDDSTDSQMDCCRPIASSNNSNNNNNRSNNNNSGQSETKNNLHQFWRRLRGRVQKFEHRDNDQATVATEPDEQQLDTTTAATTANSTIPSVAARLPTNAIGNFFGRFRSNNSTAADEKPRSSSFRFTLQPASTFDESKDIPTIQPEEIVMPGSKLQAQMALAAAKSLEEMGEECVICMEGFDPTNPRMPTLCGCGENKTYFHLPCLYQWIEQNKNCPSCRKRLRWEEF